MPTSPVTLDPSEIDESVSSVATANQPAQLNDDEIDNSSQQQGPVNPYAKLKAQGAREGWMPGQAERDQFDQATQSTPLDTSSVGGFAGSVGRNLGAGALRLVQPLVHPLRSAAGLARTVQAGMGDVGAQYDVGRGIVAPFIGKPGGEAVANIPTAVAALAGLRGAGPAAEAGEAAEAGSADAAAFAKPATPAPSGGGGDLLTQQLADHNTLNRPGFAAGSDLPSPTPLPQPSSPLGGPAPRPGFDWLEPKTELPASENGPTGALQPKPGGPQTQSGDAGARNVTLELEPTPNGIKTPELDKIVAAWEQNGSGTRATPPTQFVTQAWGALKDAVTKSGQTAAAAADVPKAEASQAASSSLDAIAEQYQASQQPGSTVPPPSPVQVGQSYIKSVLAGIDPRAAAAALGMTPQHQEQSHVGYFFVPNALGSMVPPSAPASPAQPPPAPDAATQQAQAQSQTIAEAAARAQQQATQAAQIAAGVPPPKPATVPLPLGMAHGAVNQQTVDGAGQIIRSMPPVQQPAAIREAVGNLAKWMFDTKTIVAPDGKVVNVDSQKAAQTEAVGIINDEIDRQNEQVKAQQDVQKKQAEEAQKKAQKEAEDNAKKVEEERDAALNPEKTPEGEAGMPVVEIPETRAVQLARAALQAAPKGLTGDQMDALVRRKAAVTTGVRKALVQEEIKRRAHKGEDQVQEGMMGQPAAPGQDREHLQGWADMVREGKHPFMHVPKNSDFRPAGLDKANGFAMTVVKNAQDPTFNGRYYHPKKVKAKDVETAASGPDAQKALDTLFQPHMPPVQVEEHEVEEEKPASKEGAKEEKPSSQPEPDKGETKYKFGSTQADIDPNSEAGKALAALRAKIDPADLMPSTNTSDGGGLEEASHITVRYGIKDEEFDGLRAYLEKQQPFTAQLGKTEAFPASEHSDGAVPIIVPVNSIGLRLLEKEIDKHGNFAERSFPQYKPHATVAYVIPAAASVYVGLATAQGKMFTVNSVSISKRDGTIEEVQLKGKKPATPQIAPVAGSTPLGAKPTTQAEAGKPITPQDFKTGMSIRVDKIPPGSYLTAGETYTVAVMDKGKLIDFRRENGSGTQERTGAARGGEYTLLSQPAERPTIKVGDAITFTDFNGKERKGKVKGLKPNGQPIVLTESGHRTPVPLDKIKGNEPVVAQPEPQTEQPVNGEVEEPILVEPESVRSLQEHLYQHIDKVGMPKDNNELRKIVSDFDGKPVDQARAIADKDKPKAASVTLSMLGTGALDEAVTKALQPAVDYAKKAATGTFKELVHAAGKTGTSAAKMGKEVVGALYPAALAGKDAKDIMGSALGEPGLRMFEAGNFLHGVDKMFESMPQDEQTEFIARWEAGEDQPNPDLQQAQEMLESVLEQQRLREMEAINLGRKSGVEIDLTNKRHYFPHRWRVGPGRETPPTEEEQIQNLGAHSRRPFEGSKAFMKQQRYTYAEAIEAGAQPIGNPVKQVLQRLQEGAKFVGARWAIENFKDQGLSMFLKKGKSKPEGYSYIEDKFADVWRIIQSTEETPTGEPRNYPVQTGRWIMQDQAARLLNNYLSKDHIRASNVGNGLIKLKNFTTEIRLAISAFHWLYITTENYASAISSGIDQAYNQGVRGSDPTKLSAGLGQLARSILAPFTAVKRGGQIIQYARNPDQFVESKEGKDFVDRYPDMPKLLDLLFRGGLRWDIAGSFKQSFGDHCIEAWKNGELGKGISKLAPWLAHVIAQPLFEHYIPRSKWAFAVEMLSQQLAQNSQAIADGTKTEIEVARDVAETTDNRFGEFNWDALYLNNSLRTGLQFFFRSATWKLGSWRGLAQAGKEIGQAAATSLKLANFGDNMAAKVAEQYPESKLRRGLARLPQLGMNANWIVSMGLVVAMLGGTFSKLTTHKFPWEWGQQDSATNGLPVPVNTALEAMHPRTGMVDSHGQPVRLSFPTGLKDYEHAIETPGRYFKGSMSDVAGGAWDTLANRDAFDNYVYNPNDPVWKELEQGLAYNIKGDFLPMSAANFMQAPKDESVPEKLLRTTGMVGGAPKVLDRSHALSEALAERRPHTPETPEQEEAYQYTKEHPTHGQIRRAIKDKNLDYLDRIFKYELSYPAAKAIYDDPSLTPEERRILAPILRHKQMNAVRDARRR